MFVALEKNIYQEILPEAVTHPDFSYHTISYLSQYILGSAVAQW